MTYNRTSNNRDWKGYDLDSEIKKQRDILVYKLINESNPVLIDIAVTDFLVPILRETNKITSFNYRLVLEHNENRDVD